MVAWTCQTFDLMRYVFSYFSVFEKERMLTPVRWPDVADPKLSSCPGPLWSRWSVQAANLYWTSTLVNISRHTVFLHLVAEIMNCIDISVLLWKMLNYFLWNKTVLWPTLLTLFQTKCTTGENRNSYSNISMKHFFHNQIKQETRRTQLCIKVV